MSSESEGDTGTTPSAARYRSVGSKRSRTSEEPENGNGPVVKRIYAGACVCCAYMRRGYGSVTFTIIVANPKKYLRCIKLPLICLNFISEACNCSSNAPINVLPH